MKTKTNLWHLIRVAWEIVRARPALWFWGLLASFIALESISGVVLGNLAILRQPETMGSFFISRYGTGAANGALMNYINGLGGDISLFTVSVIFFTLVILVAAVSALAHATLIRRAAIYAATPNARRIPSSLDSAPAVVPILVLTVLGRLLQYCVLVVVHIPLVYFLVSGARSLAPGAFMAGTIVFILIAAVIQFVVTYAITSVVLEDAHLGLAVERGWELFAAHPVMAACMGLWLLCARVLAVIAAVSISLIVALPLFLIYFIMSMNNFAAGTVVLAAFLVCATVIFIGVHAIYATYYISSWTVTFLAARPDSIFVRLLKSAAGAARSINPDTVRAELAKARQIVARTRKKSSA